MSMFGHMFLKNFFDTARTPNYNFSGKDHHWMIAQEPLISAADEASVDIAFRKRWVSLISVDDLVVALVAKVESLGQMDRTYFIFT